jgi:hypothetical protein
METLRRSKRPGERLQVTLRIVWANGSGR